VSWVYRAKTRLGSEAMNNYNVRAIFRAVEVAGLSTPNNVAHLKIHYPAQAPSTPEERNSGMVAAIADAPPFPVVILLPGINVGPEGLSWLAHDLTAKGLVVVSYCLIGEEFAGLVSATPGIDIPALGPALFGTKPSALALGPILAELTACNQTGLLAGRIDVSQIILGGHSAGGTTALLNANPAWFNGIVGAFSYGAHTAAATMLGHPQGTMNDICPDVPCLIMGGDCDGVIAESAARYGDPQGDATGRVIATFNHAVARNQGDCTLAILRGANHFSIINPKDPATGRAFLDQTETLANPTDLFGAIIWAFIAALLQHEGHKAAWQDVMKREHDFVILRRR
jgi:dienelactone hydrolase